MRLYFFGRVCCNRNGQCFVRPLCPNVVILITVLLKLIICSIIARVSDAGAGIENFEEMTQKVPYSNICSENYPEKKLIAIRGAYHFKSESHWP